MIGVHLMGGRFDIADYACQFFLDKNQEGSSNQLKSCNTCDCEDYTLGADHEPGDF